MLTLDTSEGTRACAINGICCDFLTPALGLRFLLTRDAQLLFLLFKAPQRNIATRFYLRPYYTSRPLIFVLLKKVSVGWNL